MFPLVLSRKVPYLLKLPYITDMLCYSVVLITLFCTPGKCYTVLSLLSRYIQGFILYLVAFSLFLLIFVHFKFVEL